MIDSLMDRYNKYDVGGREGFVTQLEDADSEQAAIEQAEQAEQEKIKQLNELHYSTTKQNLLDFATKYKYTCKANTNAKREAELKKQILEKYPSPPETFKNR